MQRVTVASDQPRESTVGKPNVHRPMSPKAEVASARPSRIGGEGCPLLGSRPAQMVAIEHGGLKLVGTDSSPFQGEYLVVCSIRKQTEVAPHSSKCPRVAPERSFTTARTPQRVSVYADTESLLGTHGRVTSLARVGPNSEHIGVKPIWEDLT